MFKQFHIILFSNYLNLFSSQDTRTSFTPGCATAQAVGCWRLTAEALVHVQVNPCVICGGQSGNGIGFSLSSLVFPVNIIPPGLHTHIPSGDEQ
jgi:hypothetical protein